MKLFYSLFFIMVISIPLFLGINTRQSNKCGEIRINIKMLEKHQENSVEKNKIVAAEIADLMAVERLENVARNNLGLRKMRPEETRLIILGGGKGHDL
ncbi:MAG: hypothetical protein FWG89_06740 [Treponema sp.]|nr:hypothetical protein [Treponema sp.]